jgi:hypothetical protein
VYGLNAISQANGWTISLVGTTVVFVGLALLATIIAHLEKPLNLWDTKQRLFKHVQAPFRETQSRKTVTVRSQRPSPDAAQVVRFKLSPEKQEVASHFKLVVERLGEPFSLTRLLEQAEKRGIPRPHSHLALFLELKLIGEDSKEGRGFYRWKGDTLLATKQDGESGRGR